MSAPNRTKKNKHAECNKGKQSISIAEFLEKKYFRSSFPANLTDGIMKINVNGVWVSPQDFDKLYPMPVVINFNHDATGIDPRKTYLHQ